MTLAELRNDVLARDVTIEALTERMADLELAADSVGWRMLVARSEMEFSRNGLKDIIDLCRVMYLKNPLIKRAINVQRYYVFGQGVTIEAKNDRVNEIVQEFWDDPRNKVELTSEDALSDKERDVQTDGNVFLALFTNNKTGLTRVRSFPVDQVQDIILNPEDRRDVWFYKRVYTKQTFDGQDPQEVTVYYPDIDHTKDMHEDGGDPHPGSTHPMNAIDGKAIEWDSPILHIREGEIGGMRFGVPEMYAACDWAKAVTTDLENYATVKQALARFAWRMTRKGGTDAIAAAKSKLNTTLNTDSRDRNPPTQTGGVFISGDADMLAPIRTAGAQPSSEDGRALRLMVAAAVGIPETILVGDADVGNLATAKSLDRPTELAMRERQKKWASVLQRLFQYVIRRSIGSETVKNGSATYREGQWLIEADGVDNEEDTKVDISFPPIVEHDPDLTIKSIATVAPLHLIPDRDLARLAMITFGMEDLDRMLDDLFDPETGERKEQTPPYGQGFDTIFGPQFDAQADGGKPPTRPSREAIADALAIVRARLTET